jgi:DNA adenine methylase
LSLLVTGQVRRIVINDLDPAIYAFWKSLVESPAEFAQMIREARLSVDEWEKQRDAYLNSPRDDYMRLGFATFYLNRTNRSGVLNGGPIGGMDQTGKYKIDARFNKDALIERARLTGMYSKYIVVHNMDGIAVIRQYADDPKTLIYADPPYFEKAGSLYLNSFTTDDHEALAACLNNLSDRRWLLTYDNVPEVARLYANRRSEEFSLNYSAHRVVKAKEIMVFSDALIIDEERLL